MNLDEIRDLLFQNMEQQQQADEQALATANRLNQQKLMYSNDARGTLYSGQPTWERAQLASQYAQDLGKLQQGYLDKRASVWENITDTMDKINSYNKAASAMKQAASNAQQANSIAEQYQQLYNQLNQGGGTSGGSGTTPTKNGLPSGVTVNNEVGRNAGWDQASDLFTGRYNYTLPGNIEVELGGWDEELMKGSDGNYYIHTKSTDTYTQVRPDIGGSTPGGGRWWIK